ncbi:hypothetical protein V1283_005876 [Bradyrhizobium sp. AZCC 2262]|uniref:hypothetical protein n=1 Tax=Bradyrhizobium sp. AZCC 2262 TaxID=3117022 RepID=UPI002FF35159
MPPDFQLHNPAIIDVFVAPDEVPNLPHLDLEQIENYAVTKVKKTVLAVTGG